MDTRAMSSKHKTTIVTRSGAMRSGTQQSMQSLRKDVENAVPFSKPTFTFRVFPFQYTEPQSLSSKEKWRLTFANRVLFVFHASLALVVGVAGTNWNLTGDLFRTTLQYNVSAGKLIPAVEAFSSLYITKLTFSFFALSAAFHFIAGTVLNRHYLFFLEYKHCPLRWIEYFFSASIMFALIAYPAGVVQVEAIALGVALIAVTMLFGVLSEWIARPCVDNQWGAPIVARLLPHFFGYIPQLAAWGVLLGIFVSNTTGEMKPPDFVFAIIIGEGVLFFSFGIVQFVCLVRPPSFYIYGEYAYQALSLIAKGLLGSILLAQVLFLSNYTCVVDPSLC